MCRRIIVCFLLAIAVAWTVEVHAQDSCPATGADGVYIYEHTNFLGRCAFFTAFGGTPNSKGDGPIVRIAKQRITRAGIFDYSLNPAE